LVAGFAGLDALLQRGIKPSTGSEAQGAFQAVFVHKVIMPRLARRCATLAAREQQDASLAVSSRASPSFVTIRS
jgi:hypothetical protein